MAWIDADSWCFLDLLRYGAPVVRRENQRLVIVGQGYVGLPLSMAAVGAGYDVVGFDVDRSKVESLAQGRSHTRDVSDETVACALASGRFRVSATTSDLAGFDLAIITVPTPLTEGIPDLSHIQMAGESLSRHLQSGATVILESTTYPGTTEMLLAPLLEAGSGLKAGVDFRLGYSPERIDPGNEQWTLTNTPKVVSGIDEESLRAVREFYDSIIETTVPTLGVREAELAKLLENTFRHVNIALVNEIAINSRALGIDIWNVIDAASSKPFGFMRFDPGPGVGGHCLPIDPSYLSWQFERELGTVSRFVKIANQINEDMPSEVVRRVQNGLNRRRKAVNGSKILVIGIAYKADSQDARETPASGVIQGLVKLGAEVSVHDKRVDPEFVLPAAATRVALDQELLESTDAVVVVTAHSDLDRKLLIDHASYIFDTRNAVHGPNVEHL